MKKQFLGTKQKAIDSSKYIGIWEEKDNKGEYHHFEIVETKNRLVFGSACNIGFLESGYMKKDNDFSLDENLQELFADLECLYNDGKEYCSHIECGECI